MDSSAVLQLLLHGNQLKRSPRSGWIQRGITPAESVADHTCGVVFISLVLAQLIGHDLDLARVLAMAVLHDLPEGLTTDIPAPAWRFMPPDVKPIVERAALQQIVKASPLEPSFVRLWEELAADQSLEAQLVHDADKLDMYLQAYVYERQTGNRQLDEFWQRSHTFHLPEARAIYELVKARREADRPT